MSNIENKDKYALLQKETRFRDKTRISLFNQKLNKKQKTCGPVEYNGKIFKQNFETGEIRLYELEEIQANKMNAVYRTKQLLLELLLMNDFEWFCTLTFDKDKINRQNEDDIYEAYEKYINNIQHQFPTLRYITVLERHESGEIHFHMLLAGVPWRNLGLENSGKVCCHWATRKNGVCSKDYYERTKHLYELTATDGQIVYNITNFIYGFTTATRICDQEACKTYISTYVDKAIGSASKFKKSFYYSKNLNVPEKVRLCIGAGFDKPEDTSILMQKDLIFQNSERVTYLDIYNIAMAEISNDKLDNIKRGLIPILEDTPFDSEVK